jgi:AcrR family transcriptional regulator
MPDAINAPASDDSASRHADEAKRRRRRHAPEDKAVRLVNATLETIADVGYARASVQEICKRADVSVGTFYEHFENKVDLLAREATEDRMLRFSPDDLGDQQELEKRLADFLWGRPGLLWRAWHAAVIAEPELQQLEQLYSGRTRDALREAVLGARHRAGLSADTAVIEGIAWTIHALAREAFRRAGGQPDGLEIVMARSIWLVVHDDDSAAGARTERPRRPPAPRARS